MIDKRIAFLAAFGGLSLVVLMAYFFSSEEELAHVQTSLPKKVLLKEEVLTPTKVIQTKTKIIASAQSKSFLASILEKIKEGNLKDISMADVRALISFFQNTSDLTSAYEEIVALYSSDIDTDSKIFLLSLLGDISTFESAQTLMHLLDVDTEPSSQLRYVAKKAISNLVYDNAQGQVNTEVSDALMQYWENSDNKAYFSDVTKAILKIGNTQSVESIVNTLNDSDTTAQEAQVIASAMKGIRAEEATALLVDKYNAGNNSSSYNDAYLQALPLIANENAIQALYVWSTTLNASEVAQVESSFTSVKQRNPQAEEIVKENLYENTLAFASVEVQNSVEAVFK